MPHRLVHHQSATELQQARRWMLEHGEVPQGMVDDTLSRSWQRSRHAGLSPIDLATEQPVCSAPDLRIALDRQHDFLAHARPVMEFVFDQMRGSGNLVVLSDPRGLLLHSLGDTDFMSRADRVSLRPGALWHEADRGTNAIGTALADQRPVVIHGAEHYLERNSFLTCSAAPVLTSAGRLQGVLDISGDQRAHHPHTFALVRSAARMIEDRLFHARHSRDQILRLHHLAEGLGAVGEGLIALSDDGWVVGANALAQQWLGLDESRIGTGTLDQLTGIQSRLMPPGKVMRLHAPGDRPLFGRMDMRQRPVLNLSGSVARAPASGTKPNTTDASPSAPDRPYEQDPRLQEALVRARRVQAQGIAVLVQGESGSGKEVFARALHAEGERAHKPFVAVNCAALPETLIEAELFGYVGGAFTGARREGSPGRIREAHGGTLFLDEIGDLPLALQVKLLRVLQERQVVRLGSRRGIPLDVRLVAATNIDLRRAVEAQHFRADLFYRLSVASVRLPPLRERPADILPLVRHFISVYRQRLNLTDVRVSDRAQEALLAYTWPGNIRELENVIHYALIVCRDHCIEPEDIRLVPLVGASQAADGSRLVVGGLGDPGAVFRPAGFASSSHQPSVPAVASPAEPSGDVVHRLQSVLADLLHAGGEALFDTVESTLVHVAFDQAGRNQVRAARLLGITRNVLRTQLKRHGLLGHADDGVALSVDELSEQESLSYPV